MYNIKNGGITYLIKQVERSEDVNRDLEKLKIEIKKNVNLLINNSQLEEAKSLVKEYKEIVSNDIEIYSIEAIILMLEDNFDEAEKIMKSGLAKDNNNFDLLYNLGYLYEEKGLFLDALETYERIVFNMEDNDLRKQIINHLNELEEKNRLKIQQQLENRNNYVEKKLYTGKKINLHLMYDSQYCDEFIQFVNDNFPNDEHKFIIANNREEKLKFMNISEMGNVEVLDIRFELSKLLYYIDNCSRIFIHYLMDYFCEIVCRFNINKPIYWPIWGGDLYNYIDIEMYDPMTKELLKKLGFGTDNKIDKNSINYIYRKATIRRIKYCLSNIIGDIEVLNEIFINNSKYLKFTYPNPAESIEYKKHREVEENIKKLNCYENIILVGNSANPSNNHLDVFDKLKNYNLENYCILTPLSYGGDEKYVDEIVKEGKKLFKDRFIPLKQYINACDYYELLSKVSIAIFNNNRQQAVGNIRILLSLGKVVFLKKEISTFKVFRDLGTEGIKSMDELECITFQENTDKAKNTNLIETEYGKSATYRYLKSIF